MKTYKLPKEFAQKWVDALRSGEYKQGDGCLYKDNCFCCLGVAGAVADVPLEQMEGEGVFELQINVLKDSDFPKQLIGCDFPHSSTYNPLVGVLTYLNDKQGKSFDEIANWIESNIEFL